jgi:hypothetical protein
MAKDRLSNYEKICEEWRLQFLEMDQKRLVQLISGLRVERDYLALSHFGREYGVHRTTGEIVSLDGRNPVSNTVSMNIFTLFGYVSSLAAVKNEWVAFEKLRGTAPFEAAFKNGIIMPFARTFTGHMDKLRSSLEAMGGTGIPYSDVGYQVNAFECIPMRFLFWEGDGEFPAQANILFDAGATDFTHSESIVSIAMVGLAQLAEEAGLPLDKSAIPLM